MPSRKILYFYVSTGFLIFLFMASLSFYGPRGSDQFWYMQETDTLIKQGMPTATNYYAGLYWREGFNEQNNYFIHHTLVHHIVTPLASLFGAYPGWLLTSVLFILLGTCLLIIATYNATSSHKIAVFTGMIFMFLPVTVWQSFNILQESIISGYMCLGVWIWERSLNPNAERCKIFFNVMGGLFGAIGVFIHPIFAIWCIGWMGKIFIERENIRSWSLWLSVGVTLAFLLVARYFKNSLLPTKFLTLGGVISNSGMSYFWDYTLSDASMQHIWGKLLSALKAQLTFNGISVIFFYPFNILLGFFIAAIIFSYRKYKLLELARYILPVFLLSGFFVMISLHQNQFRYNIIITPIILISVVMAFSKFIDTKLRGPKALFVIIVLFSVFIVTDLYLSRYIATDARASATIINQRKQGMPEESKNQKVLFIFKSLDLSLCWALYPRPVLFLPVDNLHLPESKEVVSKFNPRYVIIQQTATDTVEKILPLELKKISFKPDRLFEIVKK